MVEKSLIKGGVIQHRLAWDTSTTRVPFSVNVPWEKCSQRRSSTQAGADYGRELDATSWVKPCTWLIFGYKLTSIQPVLLHMLS